jgi:hypothetical protein
MVTKWFHFKQECQLKRLLKQVIRIIHISKYDSTTLNFLKLFGHLCTGFKKLIHRWNSLSLVTKVGATWKKLANVVKVRKFFETLGMVVKSFFSLHFVVSFCIVL